MVPPTVTVTLLQAVQEAFKRAEKTGRTQQMELGTDLYIRINVDQGRKFLLFQLEGTPEESLGHALAQALGFKDYRVGWHQGATLKSLTVEEG